MQNKKYRAAEPSGGKDTSMGKAKDKKAASKKPATNKKTNAPQRAKPQANKSMPQKRQESKPQQGQKQSKPKTRRKWNRAHEFARKKSTEREVGHPVLIVGKRSRFRRFLVFTHTPEKGKEGDYEELKHNIDPDEEGIRKSHVKKKPEISRQERLREPDKEYRIHEEDKETIKRYRQ